MDLVLDILRTSVESPWVYILVLVVASLDSLFPIVPAETALIAAASYAVSGAVTAGPHPLGLIAAATVGALIGDYAAHCVGRGSGRLAHLWSRSPRIVRMIDRSRTVFLRRGGTMLIVGRFVPGGRTATTIVSGMLDYPRWKFLAFDFLGSSAWAVYSTAIGLLGGMIFEDRPLLGVGLGIGLALSIAGSAELVRRVVERRAARGRAHDGSSSDRCDSVADTTLHVPI